MPGATQGDRWTINEAHRLGSDLAFLEVSGTALV